MIEEELELLRQLIRTTQKLSGSKLPQVPNEPEEEAAEQAEQSQRNRKG